MQEFSLKLLEVVILLSKQQSITGQHKGVLGENVHTYNKSVQLYNQSPVWANELPAHFLLLSLVASPLRKSYHNSQTPSRPFSFCYTHILSADNIIFILVRHLSRVLQDSKGSSAEETEPPIS